MKSGFQRDKLAQTGNSSSQMKANCGTAENRIQTAKYANEIKKLFRGFSYFAIQFFRPAFSRQPELPSSKLNLEK
jgi:hypothetical protein